MLQSSQHIAQCIEELRSCILCIVQHNNRKFRVICWTFDLISPRGQLAAIQNAIPVGTSTYWQQL
jgi:hypothetical protein